MKGVTNFLFESGEAANFGEVFLQNRKISSLFDLVKNCMEQDGGGHQVVFDVHLKQWVFKLTKGKTLTTALSEDNRNAYDSEYLEDIQNTFEGGYFEQEITDMGEWDIYTNYPVLEEDLPENFAKGYKVTLSRSTTYRRFGIDFADGDYIVCKSASGKWEKASNLENFHVRIAPERLGIYAWETPLDADNEQDARQLLAKMRGKKQIILKTRGLAFGKDYQLGDFVMQKIRKGMFSYNAVRKITGVNLWYEANDVGEQPIFAEEGQY